MATGMQNSITDSRSRNGNRAATAMATVAQTRTVHLAIRDEVRRGTRTARVMLDNISVNTTIPQVKAVTSNTTPISNAQLHCCCALSIGRRAIREIERSCRRTSDATFDLQDARAENVV
jgi:hypothetical protein